MVTGLQGLVTSVTIRSLLLLRTQPYHVDGQSYYHSEAANVEHQGKALDELKAQCRLAKKYFRFEIEIQEMMILLDSATDFEIFPVKISISSQIYFCC